MPVIQHEVGDVAQLLRAVFETKRQWEEREDHQRIHMWFRGQSDSRFKLLPGLYRFDHEADVDEHTYRDDFKLKSYPYLQGSRATTDWEEYALMQHYGLPTRLLDWTEGALIALQFAVFGQQAPSDVAVWMIDPQWLNQQVHQTEILFRPHQDLTAKYLPPVWHRDLPEKPLAMEMPYNSPRITAQRGTFTVHGSDRAPLESYVTDENARLRKFVVRRKDILEVRRQLRVAGMSDSVIFPDLDGLCRELWQVWVAGKVVDVDDDSPHWRKP